MATLKTTKKASPKKTSPLKEKAPASKVKAVEISVEVPQANGNEDASEAEDSDDGGVDEEGMEMLMKALGDDGLDEFEQAQLQAMTGDSDEEDEDWSDEEEGGEEDEDLEDDGEDDDVSLNEDEDEDDEVEEDIALDDVESIDGDAVPRQKIEIDNHAAMSRIRETIQLDRSFPWTETLVLSYPEAIVVDVDDDLNRELAFYKQALHGANAAKALAAKHKFPFTRPTDYFAEMVKSDSHMERIRQRLLDETAGIKKSEDKRKEREGKKFGKQVQQEKLKERQQSKKEMEERLKGLKRKRKDVLDKPQGDDDFDIAVEDAIKERPSKRGRGGSKLPREARDQKFGFGGTGRRDKQNNRESTDNFDPSSRKGSFSARGARGGGTGRGGRGGRGGGTRGGRGGSRGGGSSRGGGGGDGGGGSGGRHSSKRLGKSRRMAGKQ